MMRKLSLGVVVVMFLSVAQYAMASQPALTGHIEGVELCAEFQCGAAFFVGKFVGKVNKKNAKGGFLVSINHDPLPEPGKVTNITGGDWTLRANLRLFSGDIVSGTILNNGDGTFTIEAVLQVTFGGSGEILVKGELDHNEFPPTISADLLSP